MISGNLSKFFLSEKKRYYRLSIFCCCQWVLSIFVFSFLNTETHKLRCLFTQSYLHCFYLQGRRHIFQSGGLKNSTHHGWVAKKFFANTSSKKAVSAIFKAIFEFNVCVKADEQLLESLRNNLYFIGPEGSLSNLGD